MIRANRRRKEFSILKELKKGLATYCLLLISPALFAQYKAGSLHLQIQQVAEKYQYAGFSVAVVTKDSILYKDAFGYADVKNKVPYTIHTLQPVGSVSKTLIGFSIMKAIEQQFFTLETPINDILPFQVINPYFPDQPVQLKYLVTHTSSITDKGDTYIRSYFIRSGADTSLPLYQTMISAGVSKTPIDPTLGAFLANYFQKGGKWYHRENFLDKKPGAAYHYSNIAAALAAYLVEHSSGMSFSDYTRKFILQPFGMRASGWLPEKVDQRKLARLYSLHGQVYPAYGEVTYPDGSFITSCHDLANYLKNILKGYAGESGHLSARLFREMLSPRFTEDNYPERAPESEPNSGVFWAIDPQGNLGHTGSDPGVVAFLSFDPQTGIGRLFIANTERKNHLEGKLNDQLIELHRAVWELLDKYESKMDDQKQTDGK